jgi:hypothetical protein
MILATRKLHKLVLKQPKRSQLKRHTIKFERFCDKVEMNFRRHRVVFATKIIFFSSEFIRRSSDHTWIFAGLAIGKRSLFTIGKCSASEEF